MVAVKIPEEEAGLCSVLRYCCLRSHCVSALPAKAFIGMSAPTPDPGHPTWPDPIPSIPSSSTAPGAAIPALPPIHITSLPANYTIVPTPPDLEAYLRLRQTPGLSHKTEVQARAALHGAWFAAHVVYAPAGSSGETVAMGRVLGDGGWYFHVIDLAVAESHQRKGLGAAVLARLLAEVRERAPPGAMVNLLADPPGMKLYRKMGFGEMTPAIGMERKV